MNRRDFLSMIGLAAPTYFFAPRGGLWLPPEQRIARITSYADYSNASDFMVNKVISYNVKFAANLRVAVAFPLMSISPPLPPLRSV